MSIFADIGKAILSEDCRATSHPIFMVQECTKRRAGSSVWRNVQPFFTEVGAMDYISANGHNLRREGIPPRIYVESGYRNEEWIALRAAFIEAAKAEA